MAVRVFTDVTSDLPVAYARERNLEVLPMTVTLDDREFQYTGDPQKDGLDTHAYYDALRAGSSSRTAQVNVQLYLDVFTRAVEAGDECVYIAFSSGLSGSYEAACLAQRQIEEKYPNRLFVVDSLCASLGQGLLVHLVLDKRDEGATAEELRNYAEAMRLRVNHWFTVDDLMFLKRGGRVSGVAAVMGSVLNIKPVLYVPDRGTRDVVRKARGRKAALKSIVDGVLHDLSKIDCTGTRIHILQADCRADAEHVRDAIKTAFPQVGEITITSLGVVIGAHCGPGLLTVFYLCDSRQPE